MAELLPADEYVDTHDPAGMARWLRERAEANRQFRTHPNPQQFLENWQRNVMPHLAFRFDQAADLLERLDSLLSIAQDRNAGHCAEIQRLEGILRSWGICGWERSQPTR